MERQLRKKIDTTAKHFIVNAYEVGVSVLLIDRFLRESDWDCTILAIHDTLWDYNIQPTDYNCSSSSLIWRRYLTNILETSGMSSYEQFEEVAYQEAKDYYNINQTIFMEYWYDFNQFIGELKSPLDPAWIIRALHYFGFTFPRLAKKLRKENIHIMASGLYDIYKLNIGSHTLTNDEFKLSPKWKPSLAIYEFWRLSHQIGKDLDTIIQWTEIFTGTNVTENDINYTLTHPPRIRGKNEEL